MSDASETSLNSRSSVGSKDKLKTKRDYKPKAITEIGKHQLDPMKKQCTVCYVDNFLNTDEADDLLDELKSEFFKSSTNKEESTLELDFDQSTPRDTSLRQRIDFLKTKIQNTTDQVFKLSSQISNVVIRRLPTCKDMINNEIIKSLDDNHICFLTKFFNTCFDGGVYPWNESVITPLHKKGNKSDPDNYRAIAVSSVIGKLFSTIILERLIKYRKDSFPDPPNQLGFTKGAQTYDHILTLNTIASKYKKLKKPVYAVFVDYKKAFDSVCRQALFYRMTQHGITGKFYKVLRDMYSNSFAYIKLSGYLSKRFRISKGTEQGHPLSPDLFKIFLSDLSKLLDFRNCPELSKTQISHLLWADDLIMLSFSPETCQAQLDILGKFCEDWGIEVNEMKTQVMIFGQNKKKTIIK